MKQAIIIYGNIASGKTTLSKLLKASLGEEYKTVNLDECRVKVFGQDLGIGPIQQDLKAQELCLLEMEGKNLIYETTAVTRFFDKARKHLRAQGYKLFFVWLECKPSECYDRYSERKASGHFQAPFAYGKDKTDIRECISYFNYEQKGV
ncbi:AAA family ATPase, partial [Amycolatopsis magusensis]